MGPVLKRLLRLIPSYRLLEERKRQLITERGELLTRIATLESQHGAVQEWIKFFPPGHFYSPLPSQAEIADAFARGGFGPPFPGIDLNEAEQVARIERFAGYYAQQPFPSHPMAGRRFHLENGSYGPYDAIMLYSMLREARPRRIIEVGSGFSSAAMLDLNDHVLGGAVHFTFIDPDLGRLRPLLRPDDAGRVTLLEQRVQDVPLETFAALGENDVLFIDSSHVSKIGSDVNRLYFDVLPRLAPGVLIHIHDITGNLEYPREWLDEGRAWNEQYLLRAFLMNNSAYRIELFTAWLFNLRHAWLKAQMPLCAPGGGGQIWLRKLAR
jgi:predicted O-methyltransferase YrrM